MAALVVSSLPARVAAQRSPRRCIEELSEGELRARIDYIERALEGDEKQARWWWYGWLSIHSVLFASQVFLATAECDLGVVACEDGKDRASSVAGAIGGGLAVLTLLVQPFSPAFAGNRLDDLPDGNLEQLRHKLAAGERLLEDAAADERRWTAPLQHFVLAGWILGNSLVLPLAFDEDVDAAVLAGGSLVIAETRILTAPTDAAVAWDRYIHTANACTASSVDVGSARDEGLELGLTTVPGGLGLSLSF